MVAFSNKTVQVAIGVAAIGLGVIAPALVGGYTVMLLSRFLAMAIVALGIGLIWGQGGVLSLGQGVFFGLGGYVLAMHMKLAGGTSAQLPDFMVWSGITRLPILWVPFRSALVSVLAVLLVPGVIAAGFSWTMFRRRIGGVYFALITQALALAFATLLVSEQSWTGGFNGLTNFTTLFGFSTLSSGFALGLYYTTLAGTVLGYLGLRWLMATRFGLVLRATRDGENRVRFLGYDPTPYKVVAFTVAAMLAGVGGALFTLAAGVVSPAMVGVVPSIEMVVYVALGGRNALWGAIAGTLLVGFAKEQISSALPSLWLYALGLLFVLVVRFLPQGVAGLFDQDAGSWTRLLRFRQAGQRGAS